MEHEDSLRRLPVSTTCPSPEAYQLGPCPLSHFLKIHFNSNLTPTSGSGKSLTLKFPHQNSVYTSHLPHTCYMTQASYFSWVGYAKNICSAVQIIKLHIM
jgi:hypothetical protein